MAVLLDPALNSRVECASGSGLYGARDITVAITVRFRAATSGLRICGQWGSNPSPEWSWLMSVVDADEIGFTIAYDNSGLYGPKTTALNLASGGTYRIVARIYGLNSAAYGSDIWVNGVKVTTAPWFTGNPTSWSMNSNVTSVLFVGHEADESADGEHGDYSEFAIWRAKLPDFDCVRYGLGYAPDALSMHGRVHYAPLRSEYENRDEWGFKALTQTSADTAPHPFLFPSAPKRQVPKFVAAAPASAKGHYYRRLMAQRRA